MNPLYPGSCGGFCGGSCGGNNTRAKFRRAFFFITTYITALTVPTIIQKRERYLQSITCITTVTLLCLQYSS